jgi:hypothetical protein
MFFFFFFTEARVLQVERKSVLKPDQAEFVLSEGILIIIILHLLHYSLKSQLLLKLLSLNLSKLTI